MVRGARHIAITGATGYVGRRFLDLALASGARVTALVRRPEALPRHPELRVVPYALEVPFPEEALRGVDGVVHLAAAIAPPPGDDGDRDVAAAAALIRAAERHGTQVLFVSSQSAGPDFPTVYGRTKARIEPMVLAGGGVCIRPGLVYGGEERGVYGQICRVLRINRMIPRPLPSKTVQPIHVDDLCRALWQAIDPDTPSGVYRIGDADGVDFGVFLRSVAWFRLRRRVILVPFPLTPLIWAASVASRLPFLPPIPLDRLLGLRATEPMATREDLAVLGVRPRPLGVGLAQESEGRRRALIAEGRSLLSYVVGGRAEFGVVKRYVQAVEKVHGGVPLAMPRFLLSFPFLLRLADPSGLASRSVLARRLEFAVKVAEASPRHAGLFLNRRGVSAAAALFGLVRIGSLELALLPVRWIVQKLLHPWYARLPAAGVSFDHPEEE